MVSIPAPLVVRTRDRLLANLTVATDRNGTCYHGAHGRSVRVCLNPHAGGHVEIHRFTNRGLTWQIHLNGASSASAATAALATIPPATA